MNNKNRSTLLGGLLFVTPFLLAGEVQAGIFKCVNTKGQTVYLDKPCPVKDAETEMKAVKDPSNGYIPPAFVDNIERGNNRKLAKSTNGNAPLDKSKKPKKPSEASSLGGNGSTTAGENSPSGKRERVTNSAAVTGGGEPSLEVGASNDIQIDPLRTENY